VIEGTVTDVGSGRPLSDVQLWLEGPGADTVKRSVRSDAIGSFTLYLENPGILRDGPRTYLVHAQRIGYAPVVSDTVTLALGQVVKIKLAMSTTAQNLSTVVVTGRKSLSITQLTNVEGFEFRRARHYGTYLSADDLQLHMLGDLDVLLETELPGISATADGYLTYHRGRGDCIPHVYVDGFQRRDSVMALDELRQFQASDLYGVELYRPGDFPLAVGGSMELDAGGTSQCAVIVVWRKPLPGERRGVATTNEAGFQLLRGIVYDVATHQPIPDARIQLVDEYERPIADAAVVRTDSSGAFAIRTKRFTGGTTIPTRFRLTGQRIGYKFVATPSFRIEQDDIISLELEMSTTAQVLAPLTIVAKERPRNVALLSTSGFDLRRERGAMGTFFTRDDIDRRAPLSISDLLRGMAGVQISSGDNGDVITFRRSVGGLFGGTACQPLYVLDGMRLSDDPQSFLSTLTMDEVYGVEVYKGPSETPGEFLGLGAECGVIVIWTRHGK
jgi:TonB-dependent Receptor Plug Domain/Carboxypeptidase regulatory-like domain